jgi:hypothetical protein
MATKILLANRAAQRFELRFARCGGDLPVLTLASLRLLMGRSVCLGLRLVRKRHCRLTALLLWFPNGYSN